MSIMARVQFGLYDVGVLVSPGVSCAQNIVCPWLVRNVPPMRNT